MINRFSKIIWLVLVMVLAVTGCRQEYKADEEALAYGPDVETIVVTNDYVPRAIKATGGYAAWVKAIKLRVDCVVTFYRPDGSFYLTEQHHEIYPWSDSIRILAREPQGRFVWQLSGNNFSVLEGAELVDTLPVKVCHRYLAEAILNITTAPVRLLDSEAVFTEGPGPVKMEGLWYYPVVRRDSPGERTSSDAESYWTKVVFYQNKENFLVDMLWFAGADEKKFLAVRGYDYREVVRMDSQVEENGVLVPAKIEIFRTDARGILQERLVKIDYK